MTIRAWTHVIEHLMHDYGRILLESIARDDVATHRLLTSLLDEATYMGA